MTDEALEEAVKANQEFNEENERLKQELKEAKRQATLNKNKYEKVKQQAILNTTRFEAENNQIGQDGTRSFSEDGGLIQVSTEKLDEDIHKGKMDMLAFMEEKVTVEIHEVTDDQADHGFPVSVNGETEVFFRGQQKTVKRKFVEGLARAKKTGYRCIEKVNPQTGAKEYHYPSNTGLRFPFSVVHDPNSKGVDWLKHTLRQP